MAASVIKACLNGNRAPGAHPALPVTPEELAADGAAAVAAGAQALHIHPRGPDGRESLGAVDEAVLAVRAAVAGVPIGVSTGAWMEPDVDARVAAVLAWREPDMASVNLSEEGHVEVMAALVEAGVGIEAGLWRVEDVQALAISGYAGRLVRVLVEPRDPDVEAALATAEAIHAALDDAGIPGPRVQHGFGAPTWEVVRRAKQLGLGWRIGLEDTLTLPDGAPARSNAHLVTVALLA
ncbi:MAG: hypothetical protein V7607_6630 [Solirubrobacteraceae bacterium]